MPWMTIFEPLGAFASSAAFNSSVFFLIAAARSAPDEIFRSGLDLCGNVLDAVCKRDRIRFVCRP